MTFLTSLPRANTERFVPSDEILFDYRQRRAIEQSESAEQRRADSAQQYSMLNSADLRIRAWEKFHQLRMPSDPSHPALAAIATATQLTLEDIRNEQRLRSARRALAGA
jgi:hypothetical protein